MVLLALGASETWVKIDPLFVSMTEQLSTASCPVLVSVNFFSTSPGVTSSHPVQPWVEL